MSKMIACDHCGRLFPPDGQYETVYKVTNQFPEWERHFCEDCFAELQEWSTYEPEAANDAED